MSNYQDIVIHSKSANKLTKQNIDDKNETTLKNINDHIIYACQKGDNHTIINFYLNNDIIEILNNLGYTTNNNSRNKPIFIISWYSK